MNNHDSPRVVSAVPFGLLVAGVVSLCVVAISAAGFVTLQVLSPISPVITGIAFAILLSALLLPLQRQIRRVVRQDHAAAGVTMIAFIGGLVGVIYVTGAQLVSGFAELRDSVFAALEEIEVWLREGPLNLGDDGFGEYITQAQEWVMGNSSSLFTGALAAGSRIGTFTVALGLALVTTFFFLADGRRIWLWWVSLLPQAVEDRVDRAFSTGFTSVRAYVKTQAVVAAVDAVGIGLGALILGLPLVLPLTIIVFLASFVPVVGAFASGALVVLIAWFSQGFTVALIMVGVVLLVQQVESNLLQPVLMSRAVDLHPWGVIIGVTIGSYIYGIVGALFAVPVMALVKVVVQMLRDPDAHREPDPPQQPGWRDRFRRRTERAGSDGEPAADEPSEAGSPSPAPLGEPRQD